MTKNPTNKTNNDRRRGAVTKKPSATPSSPPIKPFFFGTVFGVLLCLTVQWLLSNNTPPTNQPNQVVHEIVEDTKPELNFYDRLQNAEVIISDESIAYETEKLSYFLQAGSFRQEADADAMRVQIILLNLDAEIREFNNDGNIWHRVIIGPLVERSKIAKTRSTLLENGIESLLLPETAIN